MMLVAEVIYSNPLLTAAMTITLSTCLWFLRHVFAPSSSCTDPRDNHVLITGCDSGFGREVAIKLDKLGFHVIATCLTSQGEEQLKQATSSRLTTYHLDLTKSGEVQDVYSKVRDVLPPNQGLWGLVNNAAIAQVGPIDWIPVENFKRVADIGLWGMMDVTKTFLPLIKTSKGRIVNVTSIAGRACLPMAVPYCVCKFGAEAFSDGLRREMAAFGITVSIVEPGFFRTNMANRENLGNQWRELWKNLDEEKRAEYGEEFYNTSVKNMMEGMVDTCASPHTYKVTDAIIHALTSSRPKARYVIGWDAKLLWIWLSRLPTSIGDFLLTLLGEKATPKRVA